MAITVLNKPQPTTEEPVLEAVGVEAAFIKMFTPHVPDILVSTAFQKEDGRFKHNWTLICFNMFKVMYAKNKILSAGSEKAATALDMEAAYCQGFAEKFKVTGDDARAARHQERADRLKTHAADLKACIQNYKL